MKLLKLNILIIFVILIDFLGNPLIAQNHWETLNVPVASRYDDVFFLNENEGFAVNSEGEY